MAIAKLLESFLVQPDSVILYLGYDKSARVQVVDNHY